MTEVLSLIIIIDHFIIHQMHSKVSLKIEKYNTALSPGGYFLQATQRLERKHGKEKVSGVKLSKTKK